MSDGKPRKLGKTRKLRANFWIRKTMGHIFGDVLPLGELLMSQLTVFRITLIKS